MSAMRAAIAASRLVSGCPLWAVLVGQFEIAWLDRGDTTNGSFEPFVTVAASLTNGSYAQETEFAKFGRCARAAIRQRSS
jgi:hypothetical protein